MKTRFSLLLAAVVGITFLSVSLPANSADVGGNIAWQQSTNIIAALSTNTPATATFTNIIIHADNQSDVCISASAAIVGIGSQAEGKVRFTLAKGDGTIYESAGSTFDVVLPGVATNNTAYVVTNLTIGGVPKLKVVNVCYTGTNCYATNIVLRYFRKAAAQKWTQ